MASNTIIKKSSSVRIKKVLQYLILYLGMSLLAVVLIVPFVFMVNRSFMTVEDCTSMSIKFFPSQWTLDAYRSLFEAHNYAKYTFNTIKIIAVNIITIPLAASLCAYGLSRIDFHGRKIIFAAAMSTIMIPGAILQVPLYILFADLGWTESALPLMIPGAFGGGAINISC